MEQTSILQLDGDWQLSFGPQTKDSPRRPGDLAGSKWRTIPAKVPGNVELDLAAAGLLPQPIYHAANIHAVQQFEEHGWFYRRSFAAPKAAGRMVLVFEGIDCITEIFLNGRSVGCAANMLIAHEFDVTDHVRPGESNDLAVRIDSAVLKGREHRPDAIEYAFVGNWESLSVRKAPHMYGWDILPRIVSAGLWRSVRLESRPAIGFGDVYWATISTDAKSRRAQAMVDWQIEGEIARGWSVQIQFERGGKVVHESRQPVLTSHGRVTLDLRDVDLWWPRGCGGSGESALYQATLTLQDAERKPLASRKTAIGLRTIQLQRTDVTDEKGGEFVFIVNGRRVYCRGTNHVPLDALHSRDLAHLAGFMEMMRDLNCNMIRCWGGNVYEDHAFFDLCDRHGIMVWQDFAMACAIYPQTDEFAAVIRDEAQHVVRKLRNHPSLALWAGNNEIDQAYSWGGGCCDPNTDIHSRRVLPEVVRRLDPHRAYLPSSPYYSSEVIRRGDLRLAPEDHLWGPRDDYKGSFYTTSPAHFVSEIGYHGCPDRASMEQMVSADHLWPWKDNRQWLNLAVCPHPENHCYDYRIPLMAKQIRVLFDRDPQNLDEFIFASQASQAEALKFFVERWRMGKWRRTGMLWWNLRDGWPVISDAVVDYFGRRKLAYRFLKTSQADLCVCVGEAANGRHELRVVSDLQQDCPLQITMRDLSSGRELPSATVTAAADASTLVGHLPQSASPAMWHITWQGGQSGCNHYLAGPRPLAPADYRKWLDACYGKDTHD